MRVLYFVMCSLFWASTAIAQTGVSFTTVVTNPNSPVDVQADQLEVDQETGKAVFTGNVRATQEKMQLGAARIEIDYDEDERKLRGMVASGSVLFVSPNEEAEAENAVYDPEAGTLEMWGSVLVLQGGTAISGERLRINLTTGQAEIIGKVRTVFGSD